MGTWIVLVVVRTFDSKNMIYCYQNEVSHSSSRDKFVKKKLTFRTSVSFYIIVRGATAYDK